MQHVAEVDWKAPFPGFQRVLLDREDTTRNQHRFYEIRWQPTLLGDWAVVRTWGRKGGSQHLQITPFETLEAAWPLIRSLVRRRLQHGYRVVGMGEGWQNGAPCDVPGDGIRKD